MNNKTKFDLLFEDILNKFNISNNPEETVVETETDVDELPDNICQICKAEIDEKVDGPMFTYSSPDKEYEHICQMCTEALANENENELAVGDVEITYVDHPYDLLKKCSGCGSLVGERELKNTNIGDLCDWCIDGDLSHGVDLSINY